MALAYDQVWLRDPSLLNRWGKPTGHVEIMWEDPITDLLTGCFLFQQNNIFKNHVAHMPDMTSGNGILPTARNGDIYFDGTSVYDLRMSNLLLDGVTTFSNTDWTFFVIADFHKSPVANNDMYIIASHNNNNGTSADFAMYMDNSGTAGRLTCFTPKLAITTTEPNFTKDNYESYSSSFHDASNDRILAINGGLFAGGDEITPNSSYARAFLNDFIYAFSTDSFERFEGYVKCLYVFNRALTATEIAHLHADPFRFIIPA